MSIAYSPVDERPVPDHNISIVVQGPLRRSGADIHAALAAIARYMPKAEVIISTWQTEDISDLQNYHVIRSVDPGGINDINGNTINLQRQVVSTLAGLQATTRPWILKTRVDVPLTGRAMARAVRYGDGVPVKHRLFRRPLVISNLFARDPARLPFLFHPSDVVQFGLRDDLLEFWQGHPFEASELLLARKPSLNPFGNYAGFTQFRVVPEQALMLRWLRMRGFDICLSRADELNRRNAMLSEQILLANFRILDAAHTDLRFPAHFLRALPARASVYREQAVPMIARDAYERPGRRFAHIWLRKYLLCFITPIWIVSTGNMILRACSPRLAEHVRAIYRRILNYRRDASY